MEIIVKTLYLLRHAEAEKRVLLEDIERKLTESGRIQVAELARRIKDSEYSFDVVLCSIAKRTIETCAILLKTMELDTAFEKKASLYNPSIEDFMANLEALDDDVNSVLIVSHNPAISDFRNFLSSHSSGLTYFSPADMEALKLDINSWKEIQENCAQASEV